MLIDQSQYEVILWLWILIAALTFILLIYVRAPYGRYEHPGWGPRISARVGWIIMESPCIIIMTSFFLYSVYKWGEIDLISTFFFIMWLTHYIHRSWIWPFRANISNKKMPIKITLMAIGFNSINSWVNAEWIFNLNFPYPKAWIYSPQFIIGFILFLIGIVINIKSDNILFSLRKHGSSDYKIPTSGLFKWVSSPNYFGEILEWIGWALATWSLAGLSFAIWAIANLVPRARSNHQWYIDNFLNYPTNRKTLIPKIW